MQNRIMDILERLKKVVGVIEAMIKDGIIDSYALGGATAANIYIEPFNTIDIDFFIHIVGEIPTLDPLRPVIDYLKPKGYVSNGVEFDIEGQLVQFIPFPDELTEEATNNADLLDLGGFSIRALSAEYLVAIMLKIHRPKDLVRAKMFWDQKAVDVAALKVLIGRYNLEAQWQRVMEM
jgi:hypothetical protein